MSTVRIQVRRGTADQWSDVNPILAAGEMGLESDTNFIKFGNGTSHWVDLAYANEPLSDLQNTLADYVLVSDVGNAGGPAKLDVDGNLLVPKSSIILEGSTANDYETTLTVTDPTADRTITFPNATGTVALTSDLNAYATTQALNSVVASLNVHQAADVATTQVLSATYAAGTSDLHGGTGIGAKLTMNANGVLIIDGYTVRLYDRVLVKDQSDLKQNGIYEVTRLGTPSVAAILTRSIDYNNSVDQTPGDVAKGDVIFVSNGTTNTLKQFSQMLEGTNTDQTVKIGTDNIEFTQISGTATLKEGTGITISADTISVNDTVFLSVANAQSTYLTPGTAASTYLTQTDAASTYLTSTNAANTYLTQTNAGTTYFAKNTTAIANSNIASNAAIDKNKISGVAITQADSGTVTNTMLAGSISNDKLAGSIANNKLANSTISGKSLGSNLDTLTIGTGLSGTSYNGGSATTIAVDSTIATKTYADSAVSTHSSSTTSVHGISDTSALATKTYADSAVSTHSSATTNIHGITNTADLLLKSGGTMTGALTLSGAPTSDLHAATKLYVDGIAAGINFHAAVKAATTTNLSTNYSNGTNGYGATLTADTNRAFTTLDGVSSWSVGERVLVKDQTTATQNGIYTLTTVGSGSTPWVLTRAADADNNPAGELTTGDFCFVTSGTTNGSKGFILNTTGTITLGTTNVNYTQFNASEAITAGTNISKNGATISVVDTPTLSGVTFSDGTQTKEGVPSRTPIISKTENYTLTNLSERDSLIEVDSTSPVTITIPTNSAVAFPVGTTLDILGVNTGLITIAGDTGVTVNATPGLKLRTQWSSCTLFKRGENAWVVYGDLKS